MICLFSVAFISCINAARVVDLPHPVGHASKIIHPFFFTRSLKRFGNQTSSIVGTLADKSLMTIIVFFCCLEIFNLKRLSL